MSLDDTSPDPDRQFWQALHASDFEAAEDALADGARIESLSAGGVPAFLHFAGDGQMEQARWLAARGANVKAVDRMRQTALHRLVLRNRPQHVAELVQLGVDPSARTASGAPALLLAVVQREPATMVQALLAAGLDPNVSAASGTTPLLAAAAAGHFALALEMIAAGANPHVVDTLGQGLLHALPQRTPTAFVGALLAAVPNLDVNLAAKSGTTPLGIAAECMDAERIELLIEHGADPNSRSANSFNDRPTALMVLANKEGAQGLPAMTMALARGADVSLRDSQGRNAAWYAANGQRDLDLAQNVSPEEQAAQWERDNHEVTRQVLEKLIAHGLDPSLPLGPDGLSPILPAPEGDEACAWIRTIVGLGFPVDPTCYDNGRTDNGRAPSPLLAMVAAKNMPAMRTLLELGADPSLPMGIKGAEKSTLLHHISHFYNDNETAQAARVMLGQLSSRTGPQIEAQRAKIKEQLTQAQDKSNAEAAGALTELAVAARTIDVRDGDGRTPLMAFLAQGNLALARVTLELGADPFARDEQGLNALGVCLQAGQVQAAHALLAHIERLGQSDQIASLLVDAAYTSPETGIARQDFFFTLHSLKEESAIAQWLSARDENGLTPLIVAAATAQEDLVDLFLAMGADPNVQDDAGNTALHHGIAQHKSDITRSLRSAGADTELANQEGVTPIEVAGTVGKAFLVKAATETVEPNTQDWPIPEVIVAARDAGRDLWTPIQIRGLPRKPTARIRMSM